MVVPPTDTPTLGLSDEALAAECEVDTFVASGPGGQKRNKTHSAVRLRHRPSGISAQASDHRLQQRNRRLALRRLRERIAVGQRNPVDLSAYRVPPALCRLLGRDQPRGIGRRNPQYPLAIQQLLDLFVALDCSVRDTAQRLERSNATISRLLLAEVWVARAVNHLRAKRGLRTLR